MSCSILTLQDAILKYFIADESTDISAIECLSSGYVSVWKTFRDNEFVIVRCAHQEGDVEDEVKGIYYLEILEYYSSIQKTSDSLDEVIKDYSNAGYDFHEDIDEYFYEEASVAHKADLLACFTDYFLSSKTIYTKVEGLVNVVALIVDSEPVHGILDK